jgi:hypothetical protein
MSMAAFNQQEIEKKIIFISLVILFAAAAKKNMCERNMSRRREIDEIKIIPSCFGWLLFLCDDDDEANRNIFLVKMMIALTYILFDKHTMNGTLDTPLRL